jgi:putative transposase
MVNYPRNYPWSSYRINAEAKSSKLITPHDEYLALSKDDRKKGAGGIIF